MPVREIADEHYRARRRITQQVSAEGRRSWRQVDPADLDGSWTPQALRMTVVLSAAQSAAAARADGYADQITADLGVESEPVGAVVPAALAGVASDGRDLRRLLLSPLITAKVAILRGAPITRALASGQANLDMILRTQVADAGRVADGIAVTARPEMGYVRHVSPPSCPRCAILAGRWYRYSSGFLRHPGCDCTMIPAPRPRTRDDVSTDLTADPKRLLREGHIQGLSRADRRAILEDGADMNRVVNARRGMYTADRGRKMTTELSRVGRQRPRPETIYREASSRDEAQRLLRLHGYLV